MSADAPPPYTVTDETKINLAHQPAVSVSPDPQHGQAVPAQVPSAPPGYEAVAYYPAASSSASNAPVLLQPQQQQLQQQLQQQQPQVIVVQSPQVVVAPQQPAARSFMTHICVACCSFLCCFSCPFSIASFILALIAQGKISSSPESARSFGTASIIISVIGIIFAVVCWGLIVFPV